jgi:hypothetical protein
VNVGEDVRTSTVGIFVGIFVGAFVSGDGVGANVSRKSAESAKEGEVSQGVFGKQARP